MKKILIILFIGSFCFIGCEKIPKQQKHIDGLRKAFRNLVCVHLADGMCLCKLEDEDNFRLGPYHCKLLLSAAVYDISQVYEGKKTDYIRSKRLTEESFTKMKLLDLHNDDLKVLGLKRIR